MVMAPTEQEHEREQPTSARGACPSYTVGYAMLPGKEGSVVQPSLVALAAERGIRLVAIDAALPLADQGPFHLIIHKLYGKKWSAQLEAYSALHPSVPIVDAPAAIERLLDRASMLAVVSGLRIAAAATTGGAGDGESTTTAICVPSQLAVHDAAVLADPDNKLLAALRFPLIAKPLAVDGSAESHELRLVYRRDGLRDLRTPLVLQEFVNHGGVLFKVYVVGDRATCVRRSSLPDVPKERLLDLDADPFVPFANISGKAPVHAGSATADDDEADNADMPAAAFVDEVAQQLRRALDLNLINFDMFRGSDGQYFIIDINYFPGFAKMPGYEKALTDFFLKMILHGRPVHGQPDLEARDAEPGPTNGVEQAEPGQAEA